MPTKKAAASKKRGQPYGTKPTKEHFTAEELIAALRREVIDPLEKRVAALEEKARTHPQRDES
jgi:hypothetical protein